MILVYLERRGTMKLRKYWIATITAVILSVLIVIVSMISRPDTAVPESSLKAEESVLSSITLDPVNAELDETLNYVITAGDAQLYIGGIEEEINALIIDLDRPLPYGTVYQLYYSKDGSGWNESYSVLGRSQADSDLLMIRLPEAYYYDGLRLDIDANYTIEDIGIIKKGNEVYSGKSYLESVLKGRSPIPFRHFLITLAIILCEALLIAWKLESIKATLEKAKKNKAALIRTCVICLGCAVLGYVAWVLMYNMKLTNSSSGYTIFLYIDICVMIGLLAAHHRQIGISPEKGFIIIALGIGLLFAVLEPASSYLSFDDEIHYSRALRLSYGDTPYISEAEMKVAMRGAPNQITIENKETASQYLNGLHFRERGGDNNSEIVPYYAAVSYLPAAGAIWLTRILGFPFTSTFIAGRVGNLLCYAIVVYFAIKQLKFGKLFAGALCLLPTILFLAGNYSYDTFCIAFILLGICIWLGVYQNPQSKKKKKKATVMLIALVMGILPKTVYCPMTMIVLFLPKNRFSSKASSIRYRWAVIMTMGLLLFSIAAPFVIGNNGSTLYSDTRGGVNVDAKGQIAYILGNPMWYAGILLRSIFEIYFKPSSIMATITGCVRATAYVDAQGVAFPEMAAVVYLVIVFIAWLLSYDQYENYKAGIPIWIKLMTCVVSFGAICVAATSMYCGFTEVGSSSIGGFQERYLLPAIIPMLLAIRPAVYYDKEIRLNWLKTRVVYAEALIMLIGMWPFIKCFM